MTGIAATRDGLGYWLVAGDGGIFNFGDARFEGSMGGKPLNDPVVGIAPSPDGDGYLLVATDGGIFGFGQFDYYGSLGAATAATRPTCRRWPASASPPTAQGYWLLEPDGWSYAFSSLGASPPTPLAATIVAIANAQVASDPDRGSFCNPYGPCEEWCALFATWVWQQAGIPIPSYPFTGNIYNWAVGAAACCPPTVPPSRATPCSTARGRGPPPPPSTSASWPSAGPTAPSSPSRGMRDPLRTSGSLAVVINGPTCPPQSANYNGMPIYAFAAPQPPRPASAAA